MELINFPSFIVISLVLTIFLTIAIIIVSHRNKDIIEKKTQFECGFNEISKNKSSFSTKFFLVIILFLIFDLEIAILLPSCSIQEFSKIRIIPPFIFLIIISLAILIEWFNGIIEWSS